MEKFIENVLGKNEKGIEEAKDYLKNVKPLVLFNNDHSSSVEFDEGNEHVTVNLMHKSDKKIITHNCSKDNGLVCKHLIASYLILDDYKSFLPKVETQDSTTLTHITPLALLSIFNDKNKGSKSDQICDFLIQATKKYYEKDIGDFLVLAVDRNYKNFALAKGILNFFDECIKNSCYIEIFSTFYSGVFLSFSKLLNADNYHYFRLDYLFNNYPLSKTKDFSVIFYSQFIDAVYKYHNDDLTQEFIDSWNPSIVMTPEFSQIDLNDRIYRYINITQNVVDVYFEAYFREICSVNYLMRIVSIYDRDNFSTFDFSHLFTTKQQFGNASLETIYKNLKQLLGYSNFCDVGFIKIKSEIRSFILEKVKNDDYDTKLDFLLLLGDKLKDFSGYFETFDIGNISVGNLSREQNLLLLKIIISSQKITFEKYNNEDSYGLANYFSKLFQGINSDDLIYVFLEKIKDEDFFPLVFSAFINSSIFVNEIPENKLIETFGFIKGGTI